MIDNIEIAIENEKSKPHNGKPITKIEVSPNEKYLVTYSKEDRSIVGWNLNDINEGQLKHNIGDEEVVNEEDEDKIKCLCVSDDKKLAYIIGDGRDGYGYSNKCGK